MAGRKVAAICQSGGEFVTNKDGSLTYTGGADAHAIEIDLQTKFDEFKSEMAEMWNCTVDNLSIKYFLPGNKRTLIAISNDKDLKRMINFHRDSVTVDVYVTIRGDVVAAPAVSNMSASRSSRTTESEAVVPVPLVAPADAAIDNHSPIDVPVETYQPLPPTFVTNGNSHQDLKLWKNAITGVDQRFNGAREFREALSKYAIAHGFNYAFKKNDNDRVTVKCKSDGCPWEIHARRLSTTQLVRIRKMNATHTCEGGDFVAIGYQSTKNWVASIIKEKVKESPNYKPKDIVNDIQREYGIKMSYSQAWRGKETAQEELQSAFKEAYNQLPWLCKKMVEANPGSVMTLITRDDLSFHRLFVAFRASLNGFLNCCRPLLFLDTMTLKSRYPGELLTATALDGNDGTFPVAFAIVDDVSDDNWHWFLVQLDSVLSTTQPLTFVSDREKGIRESISVIFKNCHHGYCLNHLAEDLKRGLKGLFTEEIARVIVAQFYDAAYTPTLEGFKKCTESIRNICPEAFEWILQSEPEHWANAFFRGARYNHLTSDIAYSFYSWVSELPGLQIIQLIHTMHRKIMELLYTHQVDSVQWSTRLTPSSEEKLQKEIFRAQSLEVLFSLSSTFEVRDDSDAINVVNIDHWGCTCKGWHITGLPCSHAVAVFGRIDRNIYDYCAKYFLTETYRLTFSESINPVPITDRAVHRESSPVQVHPPCIHRPSGQPKKRRIRSRGVVKRPLHCSKCKGAGHNKATCTTSS